MQRSQLDCFVNIVVTLFAYSRCDIEGATVSTASNIHRKKIRNGPETKSNFIGWEVGKSHRELMECFLHRRDGESENDLL